MLIRDNIRLVTPLILEISSLMSKSPHLYIDGIVSLLIRCDQSYSSIVSLPLWCGHRRQQGRANWVQGHVTHDISFFCYVL
jgi:hypothetical protein